MMPVVGSRVLYDLITTGDSSCDKHVGLLPVHKSDPRMVITCIGIILVIKCLFRKKRDGMTRILCHHLKDTSACLIEELYLMGKCVIYEGLDAKKSEWLIEINEVLAQYPVAESVVLQVGGAKPVVYTTSSGSYSSMHQKCMTEAFKGKTRV